MGEKGADPVRRHRATVNCCAGAWRSLGQAELLDKVIAFTDHRAITALSMVFGDYSLAVGDALGQVTAWFPVRTETNRSDRVLQKIHVLSQHDSAVVAIRHSLRDKSMLSLSESASCTSTT